MGMTETFRFSASGSAEQIEDGAGRLTLGFTSIEALQRLGGMGPRSEAHRVKLASLVAATSPDATREDRGAPKHCVAVRRTHVRKLIVCNFATVDGYYEARDKTIDGLFEHRHPDDAGDDSFDHDTTERLRAADTLVLSGRTSFLGNKAY
jgi:hypothetical protein